jgi:hypothetical protein
MLACSKCREFKPESAFTRRGTYQDGSIRYQSYCKSCKKISHREHYVSNRDTYLDNAKSRRTRIASKLQEYKTGRPCVDCGCYFHPYAMDFDHREGTTKSGNVSWMAGTFGNSWEKVMDEISKCDLVCAVCHRLRTYVRNGGVL